MSDIINVAVEIKQAISVKVKVKTAIAVSVVFANTVVGATLPVTYNWPEPTGRGSSQRVGDDFWVEQNIFAGARIVGRKPVLDIETHGERKGWFFLVENNTFGNKQRFTDKVGGSSYGANDNYVIDHYTGLGWDTANPNTRSSSDWEPAIDFVIGLTQSGFSDWFMPSLTQLISINNYGSTHVYDWRGLDSVAGYTLPFRYNSNSVYWTSTRNNNVTSQIQSGRRGGDIFTRSKTTNALHHLCRKHF